MLASGMTTGIQDVSNPVQQVVSTTSEAVTASATLSISQAAATGTITAGTDVKVKVTKANPNKGVESKVREYFSDLPIMAEVSKCESRYRQFSPDGSIFRGIVNSADVGVMQVNEYYHLKRAKKLGIDIHTLEGNLKYSRILYNEKGTQPWYSSAPCWKKSAVAKAMESALLAQKTVTVTTE